MGLFILEEIFWKSAAHVLLRLFGVSRRHPYRVMVVAEPMQWRDTETGAVERGGVFATRIVMATSEAEAREAALAFVRDHVLTFASDGGEMRTRFAVEESNLVEGIVWRRPRGLSFFKGSQEVDRP